MSGPAALEEQADQAAEAGDFATAKLLLERAIEAGDANPGLWSKLSAMRKASGDLRGALSALDRILAVAPLDFSALLSRALILEKSGDSSAASEFGNALAQAPPDVEIPAAMKPAVAHARKQWQQYQALVEKQLLDVIPENLSTNGRRRVERFISNRARRTRHFHQEPSDFHYPGLPEIEIHDREMFPGLTDLEAQTIEIRNEFEALIAAEAAQMVPYIQYPERVPLQQWKDLNHSRKWSAIHLLQNGKLVEANARHCPKTMAALARLPQPILPGGSPNAMFSLLAPRTRIPPHTGVANVRLVCHLPLIVPPDCGFRVGESHRRWCVGEAFVFDDTIEHEAWNESDQLRVVLIFDLWPPALSDSEREAVGAVIGQSGVGFGSG